MRYNHLYILIILLMLIGCINYKKYTESDNDLIFGTNEIIYKHQAIKYPLKIESIIKLFGNYNRLENIKNNHLFYTWDKEGFYIFTSLNSPNVTDMCIDYIKNTNYRAYPKSTSSFKVVINNTMLDSNSTISDIKKLKYYKDKNCYYSGVGPYMVRIFINKNNKIETICINSK